MSCHRLCLLLLLAVPPLFFACGGDDGPARPASAVDGGLDAPLVADAPAVPLDAGTPPGDGVPIDLPLVVPDAPAAEVGTADVPAADLAGADGAADLPAPTLDAGADAAPPPFSLPASGVCTYEGWCWARPLLGGGLGAVWAGGRDDVWVGGTGLLAHWDGAAWRGRVLDPRFGASQFSGTGPRDIWGVGSGLIHYDGSTWSQVSTGSAYPIAAVHARTPNDVWTVGALGTIRRWDGSSWTALASDTIDDLGAVWALAPNDLWVSGRTLRRWDGTRWTEDGTLVNGKPLTCVRFWAAAADKLFCVARAEGANLSRILIWSGMAWTDAGVGSMVAGAPGGDIFAAGDDFISRFEDGKFVLRRSGVERIETGSLTPIAGTPPYLSFTGLAAGDATSFFLVGQRRFDPPDGATSSLVYRFPGLNTAAPDGGTPAARITLTSLTGPAVAVSYRQKYRAIRFVAPGQALVIRDTTPLGELERFDGRDFTPVPVTTRELYAIASTSPNDVWAFGSNVASHYDGVKWTTSVFDEPAGPIAAWANAPDDVWAIGGQGQVYHRQGGPGWTKRHIPGGERTVGIWSSGPRDTWVVGPQALFHWDGATWTRMTVPGMPVYPYDLRYVWGSAPGVMWAATNFGIVFRWDGQAWHKAADRPQDTILYSHEAQIDRELCMVGNTYEVWCWNGTGWAAATLPLGGGTNIYAVAGDARARWAFASGGVVMRQER